MPAAPPLQYYDQFAEKDQAILLGALLERPELYPSLRPLLALDLFDDTLRPLARLMQEHHDQHGHLPTREYLELKFERALPKVPIGALTDAWLRQFSTDFAKLKTYELAVLKGIDHVVSGRYDLLEASLDEARAIGIGGTGAPPFVTMYADETHLVPPPQYLIDPWLIRDTVTCVYGDPESFKSFLCLHAAMCLATGTPFNGHDVQRTSVAYVAAEGQGGIAMRQDAWVEHHGVRPRRTDLVNICEPVRLLDPAHVSQFISYLKDLERQHGIKFGLIVLDTYSQCISGHDENSTEVGSAGAQAMIRIRRELDATVLFVHHLGKEKSKGMRGSGSLKANTDGAIVVDRVPGQLAATAKVERIKDAPGGASIDFTMKVVPVPRLAGQKIDASLVMEFGDKDPAAPGSLLAVLRHMEVRRQILRAMQPGETSSVKKLVERIEGMHNNSRCKERVKEALPLGERIEVKDPQGSVLGRLRRCDDAANPQNTSGLVSCEAPPG